MIKGEAEIKAQNKNEKESYFTIANVEDETQLELPYIYYPGYKVVMELDGNKQTIKTFETEKGFVGIQLPELNESKIEVKYTGTMLMVITEIVSIISLFVFLFYILYVKLKKQ